MALPILWAMVQNESGVEIPPGGLMRVTSVDENSIAHVTFPHDNQTDVLINALTPIQPHGGNAVTADRIAILPLTANTAIGRGQGHHVFPAIAAFITEEAAPLPVAGESWGTKEGSFHLHKTRRGFTILGGAGRGVVNVLPTTADRVQTVRPVSLVPVGCHYGGLRLDVDPATCVETGKEEVWMTTAPNHGPISMQAYHGLDIGYHNGRRVYSVLCCDKFGVGSASGSPSPFGPGGSGSGSGTGVGEAFCGDCVGHLSCNEYIFTISGVNGGPNCPDGVWLADCQEKMNRDWVVSLIGPCEWVSGDVGVFCLGSIRWQFTRSGSKWVLRGSPGASGADTYFVVYESSLAWNCQTNLILTKTSSEDTYCDSWPTTVTIRPLNCGSSAGECLESPSFCEDCPDELVANDLHFDVAGVLSGITTCETAAFNKTHTVTYGNDCEWLGPEFTFHASDPITVRWHLVREGPDIILELRATLDGNVVVRYEVESASWNCRSNLTVNYVESSPWCNSWPASLVLFCGSSAGGGGGGGGGSPDCSVCDDVAAEFTFTVAGITNANCVSCITLNSTWTVEITPTDCRWESPDTLEPSPCSVPAKWRLTWDGVVVRLMIISDAGLIYVTYENDTSVSGRPWDCQTAIALDFVSEDASNPCNSWPAQITISPV